MENSFLSILLFFSLFLCSCSSQLGVWSQLTPSTSPSARESHTAIYVPSSNSMLIFGGYSEASGSNFNDLWSYNIGSNSWIQLNASNPPPARWGHTAIYDSSSNSMLIFGGYSGAFLSDLWSYSISSNSWTQLNASNPPPAREGHTAIYLSSSNSMLIFGGSGDASDFNDLWSYNVGSNSWIQLNGSNPPLARDSHTAIYVSSSNSMLVFAGEDYYSNLFNDLWSYNIGSNSWIQLNGSNPPPAREGHTAIYVPSSNSMLIFGGWNDASDLNDLWNYNVGSNSWTQLNASNPPPARWGHTAIYDSSSNSMLIFGGYNGASDSNDLWNYATPLPQTTSQQTTSLQTTSPQITSQQTTSLQTTSQQTTSPQITGQQTTGSSPASQGICLQISAFLTFFLLLYI